MRRAIQEGLERLADQVAAQRGGELLGRLYLRRRCGRGRRRCRFPRKPAGGVGRLYLPRGDSWR